MLNIYTKPKAFDTGNSGWKLDSDGKVILENGNPVYVDTQGNEKSFDPSVISRLNGEAKAHREAKESAFSELEKLKENLSKFEGIDPSKANEALATIKNIDAKKLIDAGEVDRVRDEVAKGFTGQIGERDEKIQSLQNKLNNLTVQTTFNNSKFVRDRISVPLDMFQAQFGKNFKIEDDKLIPYDSSGNKIYSTNLARSGEVADFDEALEILVNNYSHKDSVLKADNHSGTGNNGQGGGQGRGRTVKRSDFEKMHPVQQAEQAKLMQSGEVSLID